jgi:hypothetical protein
VKKRNLLIIGGIAAGLVLACVVGWLIYIRIPATRFDETMDRLAELAVNVTSR